MLLHVFAHIDTNHVALIIKEHLSQGLSQLGLADTGRTKEDERANRTVRVLDAGTRTDNCLADSLHCLVLADNMLVQDFLQMYQLLTLARTQTRNRNTGPGADNLRDILLVDLFLEHHIIVAVLVLLRQISQLLLQLRQTTIFQLCQLIQVIVAFSLLHLVLHSVDFLLHLTYTGDRSLLCIPALYQLIVFLTQSCQLILELCQTVLRLSIVLLRQSLRFNLQLQNTALAFVKLRRQRINLSTQTGSSLIYQVNSLIRQKTVIDIAVRKHSSSNQGSVFNTHAMMYLITLAQTTQNRNSILNTRLFYHNRLETTLQSTVLFNIFAVLVQCRCTNAAQLATSKHRLKDIACVHSALGSTGADNGVQLINKHDNLSCALADSLQHLFQALLELTAILGTGNQRRQVQSIQCLVLQAFRHISGHDTSCQTFNNRGFADTRLTNEHRVIFLTTGKNLNRAADFLITPDNRV